MFLVFLTIIFVNIVSSDTPSNKSTPSMNLMRLMFDEHKPLTPQELIEIEEKNKQRRIELACLKKRIARLEDSSDDESSVKEKID